MHLLSAFCVDRIRPVIVYAVVIVGISLLMKLHHCIFTVGKTRTTGAYAPQETGHHCRFMAPMASTSLTDVHASLSLPLSVKLWHWVLGIHFSKQLHSLTSQTSDTTKTPDRSAGKIGQLLKSKKLLIIYTLTPGFIITIAGNVTFCAITRFAGRFAILHAFLSTSTTH